MIMFLNWFIQLLQLGVVELKRKKILDYYIKKIERGKKGRVKKITKNNYIEETT